MVTEPRRALDEYGANDMALPEIRLLQKTGGEYAKSLGGEAGKFYNTITDEILDELNIIVVDILSGRARWGQEITSSGPLCFSLDARSKESADGQDCENCEYRLDTPWSVDASERRKMCPLNYIILGIDIDHDNMPLIFRAHGVSALPARQLITQLKMNRALRGDYFRAVVNIKSQEKDTPYGNTYAVRPKIVRLVTDEAKAQELKIESLRLLGAPIPLLEGRPEEEVEPGELAPGITLEPEENLEQVRERVTEKLRKRVEEGKAPEETAGPPLAKETPKGKREPLELDLDI